MQLARRGVGAKRALIAFSVAAVLGTASGAGSGFLHGLSQDGTGPDDGLLASLSPTSGRGGGARLSAGFTTRIDSVLDQAPAAEPAAHARPL
jgi:hypothetical protein